MNVRSRRNLLKYKDDICADINSEQYIVPEIANKYKVEKSSLIKAIQRWKEMGYISKQIKIQFNPNRGPGIQAPVVTVPVVDSEPVVPKAETTFWWEDKGIKEKPETEFKYDNQEATQKLEESRYLVYTDGSCLQNIDASEDEEYGAGGWAIICLDRKNNSGSEEFFGFEDNATALYMEMKAIACALEFIPEGESATIFTDSQQSITLIESLDRWKENGWRNDFNQTPIHLDLLLNIYEMKQNKEINIQWVKGHNSDPMNTRCDMLAKTAANCQITSPLPSMLQNITEEANAEEKEMVEKTKLEIVTDDTDQMSVSQAAEMLGTTTTYMYTLIRRGKVNVIKGSGTMSISFEEVQRLEKQKAETGSFTGNPVPGWLKDHAEINNLPATISNEEKKNKEDDIVIECSDEERQFAEMYFRYGPDMAAKLIGLSPEEATLKWMQFLIMYDVNLDIRKR
jgi:ribonuclease HI